jgi:hypothetical protein
MSDHDQSEAKEILKRFHAFMVDQGDLPDDAESVRTRLSEEGIDTAPLKRWAIESVGAIKAQAMLGGAREKRLHLQEAFEKLRERIGEMTPLRKAVLAKIRALSESDPDGALVFCRKFEEIGDDDLPGLVEDLEMIEEMPDSDDESDA